MIKDSGNRTEFETGAVRDMHSGKGDMVSLPASAILRLSQHYERGALKYGRFNYQKGIPVSSFIDSGLRHLFKYLDGWDDEDHLSAAAFNILGAMEMESRHPELIDLPTRSGKDTYPYLLEKQLRCNSSCIHYELSENDIFPCNECCRRFKGIDDMFVPKPGAEEGHEKS